MLDTRLRKGSIILLFCVDFAVGFPTESRCQDPPPESVPAVPPPDAGPAITVSRQGPILGHGGQWDFEINGSLGSQACDDNLQRAISRVLGNISEQIFFPVGMRLKVNVGHAVGGLPAPGQLNSTGLLAVSRVFYFVSDFSCQPFTDAAYPTSLAEAISNTRISSPTDAQIDIVSTCEGLNFSTEGMECSDHGTNVDALILHELWHNLGGHPSLTCDVGARGRRRSCAYGVATPSRQDPEDVSPTVFDRFVGNARGALLVSHRSRSPQLLRAFRARVFFHGSHSRAANHGSSVPLCLTANGFEQDRDLAHLDPSQLTGSVDVRDTVIAADIPEGRCVSRFGSVTLAMLRDMGWSVAPVVSQVAPVIVQADSNSVDLQFGTAMDEVDGFLILRSTSQSPCVPPRDGESLHEDSDAANGFRVVALSTSSDATDESVVSGSTYTYYAVPYNVGVDVSAAHAGEIIRPHRYNFGAECTHGTQVAIP